MAPTILALGLTGYIGGDAIAHILATYPTYHVRAVVRDPSVLPASFQAQHPNLTVILGSLDSLSLLTSEAAAADLVLQLADGDHVPGTLALLTALSGPQSQSQSPNPSKRRTYIHMSGAAGIIDFSFPFGSFYPRAYSDVADAAAITTLPADRLHAAIEQQIVAKGEELGVRTAIVSPSMVYGLGRGPVKQRGYAPLYVETVMKRGRPFVVGAGENVQSQVHVSDIATGVEALVARAFVEASDASASVSAVGEHWGQEGYHYASSDAAETSFLQHATTVAKALKARDLIQSEEVEHLEAEAALGIHPYGALLWGSSVRVRAERLRSLGWAPKGESLEESLLGEIDAIVKGK